MHSLSTLLAAIVCVPRTTLNMRRCSWHPVSPSNAVLVSFGASNLSLQPLFKTLAPGVSGRPGCLRAEYRRRIMQEGHGGMPPWAHHQGGGRGQDERLSAITGPFSCRVWCHSRAEASPPGLPSTRRCWGPAES